MTLIEAGVATMMPEGQTVSGDRHMVHSFTDGVLVAVADGLGHGVEAAAAADAAVRTLEGHAGEPLISLLRHCHEALRSTRGVVMSLASLNARERTMTWLGVGNVEGVLLRANPEASRQAEMLLLRGGVVGGKLPSLLAAATSIAHGDTLIFATDGIRNGFAQDLSPEEPPQRIADRVMAGYRRKTDDALVLVVRYVGYKP